MATVRIQIRRGTAAEWTSANPTLAAGEVGLETDTRKIKFGDGSTAWSSLSYLNPGDIDELSQDAVNAALTMGSGLTKSYNDGSNTITLSLDTGVVATLTGTQTLTNKTISGSSNTISLHGKTASSWVSSNPVLAGGELGIETDTGKIKVGDGVAAWNSITSYINVLPSQLVTTNVSEGTNLYFTDERAQDAVGNSVGTGLTYTDATGEIKVTPNTYEAYGATSTHAALTSTHGVSGSLVGTTDIQTLTNKTLTSPTINTPTGITKSDVGLSNVDNTSDANKPVSTATQSALDLKAPLASPTFTGTVTLPSGTITSGMIADGTIVNADINASAAIALSKLATDPLARANHTGTQTASTISDFDTQVRTSRLDQMASPTANVSFGGKAITNLADPGQATDAATKQYVDAATAGLNVHASVKAATTTNITLASAVENGDTLDGVTLATGDRILVKNQTTKADNGVYIVEATGAPTRATDYDSVGEVDAGDFIFVEGGTVNAKTGWVQTNTITTIGTDAIEFTQFAGAGTYTAGTGLTLTGSTFSINTGTTVDLSTAQTLTNKTINLSSNTISGTLAEFNTAVSNADLASLAGAETLTNKTINGANNTLTVRLANDVSGTLPAANGGTGITSLGTGIATFLGTPSSSNLASAVTDETGSGSLVFATSPTLVTPNLGTPSALTLTNATGLPVAGITSSTTQSLGLGSIELGHASDTTIARSAAGVITVEGVVVPTISSTNTLTNKSIALGSNTVTGTIAEFNAAVTDADFATLAGSETLSNKTLTAPKFATGGEIDDANGAELIKFPSTVASAVNEITVSNAATGSAPVISATGDDTNISLGLTPKGSGVVSANGVLTVTGSTINLNGSTPAISSSSATAASIFTANVTGITIGSSSIKSTLFPTDGTTSTAAAGVGFMGMPQVSTGVSRTIAATDAGKHIYVTATGTTQTIPANSSVAFPIGTTISIINGSGVSTSIAITTDTLRLANSASTGTRTLASNGFATLVKINSTEWMAGGNGLT